MKYLYLSFALIAAIFTTTARAETINCTEITAIPTIISVQGVYCLKGNLATNLAAGNMIDIQTNNVTIDFNGFKLGGLAAGAGTNANGVFAQDRKNITVRNGSVRGFANGVFLSQTVADGSAGHLIEDMLLDGNKRSGIRVGGSGMILRRNRVVNTGPGTFAASANAIEIISANNSVIADNLVSGTSETGSITGILIALSKLIEVSGNTIFDTKGAVDNIGILISQSTDVTLVGNHILNAAGTGTVGVEDLNTSTGLNCIGNTVVGFTSAFSGCDFEAGNNMP